MGNLKNIKLIIFDVDGVLTDGTIGLDDHGIESKHFHVRDGFAIRAAKRLGLAVGVVSGRASRSVTHRNNELGIDLALLGVRDKAIGLETLCQRAGKDPQQAAFVGDDLIDLPAMLYCGYPIAVADAVAEVKAVAQHITHHRGGCGAARDAIEHILKAQQRWDELLEQYGI